MKKIFNLFFIMLSLLFCVKADAMTFEQGFDQCSTTPLALLIYADWADGYQNHIQQFRALQGEFGTDFNFVELNIADKDAKAFNSKYQIYPNLPYVLMIRSKGKIFRYIERDCAGSAACMAPKFKSFIRQ